MSEQQSGDNLPQKKQPEIIDTVLSSKIGPGGKVIRIAHPLDTDGTPMLPLENREVIGHDAEGKPVIDPIQPGDLLNRTSTEPKQEVQTGYGKKGPRPLPPGQNINRKI